MLNTVELISNGYADVFVLKLDVNGNYLWAKSFGGSTNDSGQSVAVDDQGSVYVTGDFGETVDFDIVELTSNGEYDVFVLKLDVNGDCLWAKSFGSSDYDKGSSITTDNQRNIYITGEFRGTVDFGSIDNTTEFTSNGAQDIFVLKLDGNGDYLWAKSFGGSSTDVGSSITIDNEGDSYITGLFSRTVDFDSSTSTTELTSNGTYDMFILKLNDCSSSNNCILNSDDSNLSFNNKIKISPNPVSEIVTVHQDNNDVLKLEIFNSTHKLYEAIIDEKITKIDLTLFSSGVYFFKTTVKDVVSYEKIIVL